MNNILTATLRTAILIFVIFFSWTLNAQNGPASCLRIDENKKVAYYRGSAKKAEKANRKLDAAEYGVKRTEPSTRDVSKEVGEEGKKKKVSAKITSYSKHPFATMEGSYEITDNQTGAILASGQLKGEHGSHQYWSKYSGSLEALSKREKKDVKPEPETYSRKDMYKSASNHLSDKLAKAVNDYFTELQKHEPVDFTGVR